MVKNLHVSRSPTTKST